MKEIILVYTKTHPTIFNLKHNFALLLLLKICKMAATLSSLREILLNGEPPKVLIDRKTEMPILSDGLLQRLKKATTREEGIAIAEDAKKEMVIITFVKNIKCSYIIQIINFSQLIVFNLHCCSSQPVFKYLVHQFSIFKVLP